jgi:FkbM family methyltransferase
MDIGANVGLISAPLALAIRSGTSSRPCVVAIEALPDNCTALRKNIVLNSLEDCVSIHELALGDVTRDALINVEGDLERGEGSGTASIDPDGWTESRVLQTVHVVTMDALWEEGRLPPGCHVIKLDTDGYDLKIMRGSREFLSFHRPVIFGEFHAECEGWHGHGLKDVITFAAGGNYVVWQRLAKSFFFSSTISPDDYVQDLLLVPRETVAAMRWCMRD